MGSRLFQSKYLMRNFDLFSPFYAHGFLVRGEFICMSGDAASQALCCYVVPSAPRCPCVISHTESLRPCAWITRRTVQRKWEIHTCFFPLCFSSFSCMKSLKAVTIFNELKKLSSVVYFSLDGNQATHACIPTSHWELSGVINKGRAYICSVIIISLNPVSFTLLKMSENMFNKWSSFIVSQYQIMRVVLSHPRALFDLGNTIFLKANPGKAL